MTQLDIDILLRKLRKIERYLNELTKQSEITAEAYAADFTQQLIVERLLHLLIEAASDINSHILTTHTQTDAATYRDGFLELGKIGIIPQALANQLAPAAGLRNRLVHDYDDIDDTIVYQSISFALNLFPDYVEKIQGYLKSNQV